VKRTSLADHPCSIARTLDVAGEWWSPLILRDVAYGIRRFGEIQEDLGISANVLSDRLETMVSEGLLEQRLYQRRPDRHEYWLTHKGSELVPALLALMRWGDRWASPRGSGPVAVTHGECGHEISVEVRCEHCERELELRELVAQTRSRDARGPAEGQPGHVSAERLGSSPEGVRLDVP
jgi:DNA-binding HxlR family transcriptional regulator